MFDRENNFGLPEDVLSAVKAFVKEAEDYVARFSPSEANASADSAYFVLQEHGIMVDTKTRQQKPQWTQADKEEGKPSIMGIASMLFKASGGKYRLTWYAFGGGTQMKGGRIIRSLPFDWVNSDPKESDAMVAADIIGADISGVTSLLARTIDDSKERERQTRMDMREQIRLNNEMVIRFGDLMEKVVSRTLTQSEAILREARFHRDEARELRDNSYRMQTAAMRAERRAVLTLDQAREEMHALEDALENGEATAIDRILGPLLASPDGRIMVANVVDKVLDKLGGLLGTKSTSTEAKKITTGSIMKLVQSLDLTEEQSNKVTNFLVNNPMG